MRVDQSEFKRPESVLVVVYTNDARVLMMQRRDNDTFWQSVTGSLEKCETPFQAAGRELHEETGLAGTLVDHKSSIEFAIKGPWRARYAPEVTHNREHLFSIQFPQVQEVNLDPDEHLSYCWLSLEEAVNRASSSTNRAAIQKIVMASGGSRATSLGG